MISPPLCRSCSYLMGCSALRNTSMAWHYIARRCDIDMTSTPAAIAHWRRISGQVSGAQVGAPAVQLEAPVPRLLQAARAAGRAALRRTRCNARLRGACRVRLLHVRLCAKVICKVYLHL